MNRYVFVLIFILFSFISKAQVALPVWYKKSQIDLRKVSFTKYIKNNSTFSLIKAIDTIQIPQQVSILLIDREGKFFQELNFDTATYTNNREQIIAGKRKLGIFTLKGDAIIPADYLEIRFAQNLYALKNQEYLWALYDNKGNKLSDFIYTDMVFTDFGKIKTKNKKGTGVLNADGTVLFENIYSDINHYSQDSFLLKEMDKWNHIGRDKSIKFTWDSDSIRALNDSLYIHYSEGRVFLRDSLGKIIGSENGYYKIEKFTSTVVKISYDQYSGLMNLYGKEILPVKYYQLKRDTTTGYIMALGDEVKVLRYGDVINKNKKRWSLHDSSGQKILAKQYKNIRSSREGFVAVQNDENLWGYADLKGNIIIQPKYSYASDFKNGFALVRLPGSDQNDYRLINEQENKIYSGKEAQLFYLNVIRYRTCVDSLRREDEPIEELYYGIPPWRYDYIIPAEYGYLRVKNGDYTGVLNAEGRVVVQAYQDTVYLASADTFFLYKRNNGLVGYADGYCNTTLNLTAKFEGVQPLHERYSKFKKDGLYGFVDPYGNVPIAPKYTACGEFHDGMVSVFLKGKWGFVDKEENILVQPYYKEVKNFRNGFAPVKTVKNKWIFIDKTGKQINTSLYDDFYETKNGKYIVFKNKKWGITESNGKEILSPKYEYVEELGNGLLKIKRDGKFGVLDFQENIVLYYQYDNVLYNPYWDSFFVATKGQSSRVKMPMVGK